MALLYHFYVSLPEQPIKSFKKHIMTDRREFLKTMAIGGASALVAPSLLSSCTQSENESAITDSGLIVPKDNGLRITGTFLDEISHDIPHQNWGEKE